MLLALALALSACSSNDNGGGTTGGGNTGTTAASGSTSSSGGTVSPADYAKSLCTSMQNYVTNVTNLSNNFASSLDPSADLAGQRDAVAGFLDDVLSATDQLISDLDAAGVPDVANGQEIVSSIKAAYQQARQAIDDAKKQVQGLSLDDPTAFASQLSDIGTAIQSSLGDIGGSLSTLDSPELSAAVSSEPSCAAIASGASGASGSS
jgi:hypothetical protein